MEDSIEFKRGAVTLEENALMTNTDRDELRASYLAFEDKLQQIMKDTVTSGFKEQTNNEGDDNVMGQTMMTDLKMPTQVNFSKFKHLDKDMKVSGGDIRKHPYFKNDAVLTQSSIKRMDKKWQETDTKFKEQA